MQFVPSWVQIWLLSLRWVQRLLGKRLERKSQMHGAQHGMWLSHMRGLSPHNNISGAFHELRTLHSLHLLLRTRKGVLPMPNLLKVFRKHVNVLYRNRKNDWKSCNAVRVPRLRLFNILQRLWKEIWMQFPFHLPQMPALCIFQYRSIKNHQ